MPLAQVKTALRGALIQPGDAGSDETQALNDFEQLKNRLKTTWMTGDYDLFSRFMEKGAEQFFQRLGVTPGTRLLDVGCGAGQ